MTAPSVRSVRIAALAEISAAVNFSGSDVISAANSETRACSVTVVTFYETEQNK